MIAVLHRICAPAFAVALVAGLSVATMSTAYATQPAKGQSTTHLVYCQKTGNHWTITKGDNPSDNKNRTQVGTWNEHERGEGWNQARAEQEFLSKCTTTEPTQPTTPTTPPVTTPGNGNNGPKPTTPAPGKGQSTTHLVFCQKTGNHWTITKGDNPSDNKNRTQVGTWNEHERGEGWNQARAEQEFLSKCRVSVPATPVTPTETPTPGKGGVSPAPVKTAVNTVVTELPRTGSLGMAGLVLGLMTTVAAYGITYVLQPKQ